VAALQRGLAGGTIRAMRAVMYLLFERRYYAWRRRLGMPPKRDSFLNEWSGDALNLGWSPTFRPPMPDDPPRSLICGFPFFDGQHGADEPNATEEVGRFLEDGDPPIVFSLGTTAVHRLGPFFVLCWREYPGYPGGGR